jgi:cytidylate kinase
MKVLILDNYDSFTYNLKHYVEAWGAEVDVKRNDEIALDEVAGYDKIILSPGPGLPAHAGIMPELIAEYAGKIPLFGVCLGHQCIAEHFGGRLYNLPQVLHGQASICKVQKDDMLFKGLASSFEVGHYHSWVVDTEGFPHDELEITGLSEDGLIMSLRHRTMDVRGVQFHPESILTPHGRTLLYNWLDGSGTVLSSSMKRKINIAIDGHSACGKSTVAKMLASSLGYLYIDSGSMYRAIALFALENGLADGKTVKAEGLKARLDEIDVKLVRGIDGQAHTLLNGQDVEKDIRTMRVSAVVSPLSTIPEVRTKLVLLQQAMATERGVVMDGRDIGTVVLPEAELKIFLTASLEERARRRWAELAQRGVDLPMAEVIENLTERDFIDTTRAVSPLVQAADAILLDNSSMDALQTYHHIKQMAKVLKGEVQAN